MELVKKAETALAGIYKGAPKMSDKSRESLAKAWPIIALVFGVLQLWAVWVLWDLVRVADRTISYFGTYLGGVYGYSAKDKFFIYLGIVMLAVDAVILLMAYSPLKNRQKKGWDLLFLGALLNVVYGVANLFITGRGVADFIGSLIGSAIAFYLLFQVREKFKA